MSFQPQHIATRHYTNNSWWTVCKHCWTKIATSRTNASSHSITEGMRRLFRSSKHGSQPSNAEEASVKSHYPKGKAWRCVVKSWNRTEGTLCSMHVDEIDVPVPYDCFAFFITLDQYFSSDGPGVNKRQLEYLIFEKASPDDNTFYRCGKIPFYDEFAVKMRYQVAFKNHFRGFEKPHVGEVAFPQELIAAFQLMQAGKSGGDGKDGKTVWRGVDGLYQLDGHVQQAFPWLVELEPVVLEIV